MGLKQIKQLTIHMKNTLRILTLTSGILLSSLLVSEAKTETTSSNEITLPTVKRVVAPILTKNQAGQEVLMQFKVHASGYVYGIKAVDTQPGTDRLVRSLKRAMPHWEFEPARDSNGKAMIVEVILPIKITGKGSHAEKLAMVSPAAIQLTEQKS